MINKDLGKKNEKEERKKKENLLKNGLKDLTIEAFWYMNSKKISRVRGWIHIRSKKLDPAGHKKSESSAI
mgnify:CR=1 FL=1